LAYAHKTSNDYVQSQKIIKGGKIMVDQTLDSIKHVQENNKGKLYEKRKQAIESIKELLTKFSSDDLIDIIMKEKDNG